jgi:uncharacterized protein (TIGR03663 family)
MDQHTPPRCDDHDGGLSRYFSPIQWGIYILIVLGALLFRWVALDARPLHHDESLHAMYGKYFYDFPTAQYYKYDPMLHGPFLYTIVFLAYCSFGVTDWVARFPAALLGSLFVITPLLFRRYFSPTALILLTIGIGYSPSLIYWARFLREDVFVIFGILLSVYGVAVADRKQAPVLFFLGLAIQMCSKENWFVHVAMMAGFYLFDLGFYFFTGRQSVPYLADLWRWCKEYWFYGIVGAAVLVFVYTLFYTAGFQYFEGPLDGLYRKSLVYWFEHHGKERIVGPFLHHAYCLAWYDSLFAILAIFHLFHLYRRAPAWMGYAAAMIGTFAFATSLLFLRGKNFSNLDDGLFKSFVAFFKLKDSLDVSAFIVMIPHAVLVTVFHLLRRERRLAITGYTFATSLFTYSYLGEKVPWLSQYPLWAGLIYLTLYFDSLTNLREVILRRVSAEQIIFTTGVILMILGIIFLVQDEGKGWSTSSLWILGIGATLVCLDLVQWGLATLIQSAEFAGGNVVPSNRFRWSEMPIGQALVVLALAYLIRMAAIVNFTHAGSEKEYISQVHTTNELKRVVTHLRSEIENESRGYRPRIYIEGDAVWPVVWYLRDLPENKFGASAAERREFKYQLIDLDPGNRAEDSIYKKRQLTLRGWWVPNFEDMTLKKFLWYAITHQPWSGTGFAYTMLLTRRAEESGQ